MKSFNIEKIKPNLGFKIAHKSACLPTIRELISDSNDCFIDFDVYLESYSVNLQRDFVWTIQQKRELILSLFKEMFIPQLCVVQYKDENLKTTVFKIIDGKQRLSTILSFVKNEFDIPCGDEMFFFDELPEKQKNFILNYYPTAQLAYSYWDAKISDESLIKWFKLVNFAGTPQDNEHINFLNEKLK